MEGFTKYGLESILLDDLLAFVVAAVIANRMG
jgi:hypothetical protein